MTQNPYAQPQPGFENPMPVSARTSVAAILSLVCALVCFVPGMGILAIILGIAALVMISASDGRVTGKGLAISGIFIGILMTLVWGGVALVLNRANKFLDQQIVGKASQIFQAMESQNYSQVASLMNTPAGITPPTDAEFAAFVAAYQAEVGSFQKTPKGLSELFQAYMKMQNFNMQNISPGQIPIPAEFSKGSALVILDAPPNYQSTPAVMSLTNIGVLSSGGKMIWLVPKAAPSPTGTPAPPAPPSGTPPPAPSPGGG